MLKKNDIDGDGKLDDNELHSIFLALDSRNDHLHTDIFATTTTIGVTALMFRNLRNTNEGFTGLSLKEAFKAWGRCTPLNLIGALAAGLFIGSLIDEKYNKVWYEGREELRNLEYLSNHKEA